MIDLAKKIELCDYERCTGCMACKQKCSYNAINGIFIKGFAYPSINDDLCKKCGQCVNVCPVLNKKNLAGNKHENETSCLAGYSKDDYNRLNSSSGGAFSVLAKAVLSQGGVVFGAAWNENLQLEHKFIESLDDLDSLKKSKYVQSAIGNSFKQVVDFLKKEKKVLFCGTPCQIAGLNSFIGNKKYDNLYMIDILCQGVPSQQSFNKYIHEIESKIDAKIVNCNFRSKIYGWRCGLLLLLCDVLKNGKLRQYKFFNSSNAYYNAFIKEYFMRPSCYDCNFKCNRQGYYSDITLADFWRIGNKVPFKVDSYENGVSAVILNTDKGKQLLSSCEDDFVMTTRSWDEFSTNGGLRNSKKPKNNDEAFDYLQQHSWLETQQKFFPVTIKHKIKILVFILLGERRLRKVLKLVGKIK